MKKYYLAFVAGSSFPVVLWPFLYHGVPFLYNSQVESGFLGTAVGFPVVMGILNIFYVSIQKSLPFQEKTNYWIFGALQGLLFSLYGNFGANLPTEHFLLEGAMQYLTIPIATLIYALLWRYVIRNLNRTFSTD